MRIASLGHAAFAATMISLGVLGLVQGDFASVWQPVPKGIPAREALIYLCGFLPLLTGIGLLLPRTAAVASRVLLAYLLAWLLLLRVPRVFSAFNVNTWWATAEAAVIAAAGWVPYVWFASEQDSPRLGFATGASGLRIARTLFAVGLIPFGLAHFIYLKQTTVLIPSWPWPDAWAYGTGAAFIAAGVAIVLRVWPRLAAALAAVQIGGFTLIVWVPVVLRGASASQWQEFVASYVLTAAAWMVADSWRGTPWLAVGKG